MTLVFDILACHKIVHDFKARLFFTIDIHIDAKFANYNALSKNKNFGFYSFTVEQVTFVTRQSKYCNDKFNASVLCKLLVNLY